MGVLGPGERKGVGLGITSKEVKGAWDEGTGLEGLQGGSQHPKTA